MKLSRFGLATVALSAFFCTAAYGQTTYQLDFGVNNSAVTTGYTQVIANFLADTATASAFSIAGTGSGQTINFSIDHVGSFNSGSATEPLTTDGFYTFGNGANEHNFTITGLTVGQLVTIYAVAAWDGNGRGANVIFGGSNTQAQTVGDPGTSPTTANFTQINLLPAVADATGTVTGSITGAGGVASQEGQVGGFIIQVSAAAVPEPSTIGLLIFGGLSAFGLALRRK